MNTSRNVLTLPSANPRNPELLAEMGLQPSEESPLPSTPSERRKRGASKEKLGDETASSTDSVPGLEPKLIEKKIRVSSYFTPEEHWRLRMLALKQNLSVSDYLRSLALAES